MNSQLSCLSLPLAGIIGLGHLVWRPGSFSNITEGCAPAHRFLITLEVGPGQQGWRPPCTTLTPAAGVVGSAVPEVMSPPAPTTLDFGVHSRKEHPGGSDGGSHTDSVNCRLEPPIALPPLPVGSVELNSFGLQFHCQTAGSP